MEFSAAHETAAVKKHTLWGFGDKVAAEASW